NGQGLGLRWQNSRNSPARSLGRIMRLACTWPGARPAVGPVWPPWRIKARQRAGSGAGVVRVTSSWLMEAPYRWARLLECPERVGLVQLLVRMRGYKEF